MSRLIFLNHIRLASFMWTNASSADPKQKQHNAVSDQDLHRLITEFSNKIWRKYTKNPKIGNGLIDNRDSCTPDKDV